jgi:hypothetical protein
MGYTDGRNEIELIISFWCSWDDHSCYFSIIIPIFVINEYGYSSQHASGCLRIVFNMRCVRVLHVSVLPEIKF